MSFLSIPKDQWIKVFIGQEENGQWVTIHGTHIFIKEGESIESAIQRHFGITREGRSMVEVGRAGGTKILASSNVHPEVVKAVTDTFPKTPGHQLISEVRIYDTEGRPFAVGGTSYLEMAHFDPRDFSVSFYPGDKKEYAELIKDKTLPHEVAHAVFAKEYNDSARIAEKYSSYESRQYMHDTLTKYNAITPGGWERDISDEDLEKLNKELKDAGYPPYEKGQSEYEYRDKVINSFHPEIDNFIAGTKKEGGVTDYAISYLKEMNKRVREGKLDLGAEYSASTENFAELAALKSSGSMWEITKAIHPRTVESFEKIMSKYSEG